MKLARSQWITCGLGLGIVTGLIVSIVQAVFNDWVLLDTQLPFNLAWSSALGYFVGFGTCPVPKTKTPVIWRSRFSIRAMMVAVAAVGIILGIGIVAHRISRAARLYQQMANTAERKVHYYRSQAYQVQSVELQVVQPMKPLGAESLPLGQKDSRQSPDQGESYESRMQRHNRMAGTAQRPPQFQHPFNNWCREMAEYQAMLVDKYRRAMRRPWLPVAPDPPEPAGL
jgi:hypothetical protein